MTLITLGIDQLRFTANVFEEVIAFVENRHRLRLYDVEIAALLQFILARHGKLASERSGCAFKTCEVYKLYLNQPLHRM